MKNDTGLRRLTVLLVLPCLLSSYDSGDGSAAREFRGELSCDFTRDNSLKRISPPGSDTGGVIFYEGQFKVTVKLPRGGEYSGDASLVSVKKGPDDTVQLFHIRTSLDTLEATCRQAQRVLEEWRLPRKNLDEWKAEAAKDPNYAFYFDSMDNSLLPSYSLGIRRSQFDPTLWCLFLEIHWAKTS